MPNHVKNRISKDVAKLLKGDDCLIDFNSVKKMPKSLIDPDPQQMADRARAALGLIENTDDLEGINKLVSKLNISNAIDGFFRPVKDDDVELLITAIRNIKSYGCAYWRDWSIENWGTKWNAYDCFEDGENVVFETAWSHPNKVFIKLSKDNPELKIECTYADEDIGSNCKEVHYAGGEIVFSRDLSEKEAFELNYPKDDYEEYKKEMQEDC